MSLENAENVLKNFIIAMNNWEKHYYPLVKNGSSEEVRLSMINDLNCIFNKFCTKKERKYGRQVSLGCGNPPEYSPDEKFLKTEELKNTKIVIYTQEQKGVKDQFRYTLHFKNHEWLIDKKEVYDDIDNKWEKYTL
ncbi:hypothetical protein A9G09_02875 [Gilliamella sp. wkB292]|uniref:NTF2 fold immunity protein n=1 Tax=unclassified Gilliamella TaxID=2685620 RepID=UPI00080DF579|nr:NTF2 fold immunity protein [Gilliamella apicola]OCG16560.1 hypothetical protein A9G09_02875 [Gilliamella apicola]OCL22673.1 hypothetical protein A9G03_04740 [Gilliamella apicola]